MEIQDLKRYFGALEVPVELKDLIEFEKNILGDNLHLPGYKYSEGFELYLSAAEFSPADTKGFSISTGLRTCSEDPNFLAGLIEFAQADGTGSFYAFWVGDYLEQSLSQVPIAVFGSEGGFHIVAENIRGLLQILTLDVEPMVDFERVYYCKDEQNEPSAGSRIYQEWLRKKYGLATVNNADAVVANAQSKFQNQFLAWFEHYCPG